MVVEVLPTTSQMKFINKKEFAKVAIDKNPKTFVVYMSALNIVESTIHPFQAAQIAVL